ncbi:ribosome recycling factor [Candidatus Woesebacteria bacterium]|nr:ribosome recycling factor [Candidatus Woesebacteria bacterium]
MADYIPQFRITAQQVRAHFQAELNKVRTGRASVNLVDSVMVEAYGTRMHLQEVASISSPDPTLIVISPWDKSLMGAIDKGVRMADLGISPVVDTDVVRLPIPSLTQEKRQELVKIVAKKHEEAKILLRNARAEVKQLIESQKDESGISEDDIKADIEVLDKDHREEVEALEKIAKEKEVVLTTI